MITLVTEATTDEKETKPRYQHMPLLRPKEPPMAERVNTYRVHWTSKMLMPLPDELFSSLTKSIQEEGQLEPILLWKTPKKEEWVVIDGNHRQQACNILGIKVRVDKLPIATDEKELPYKVLSKQFLGRGSDKTYCCCEALDAIIELKNAGMKSSASSMVKRYPTCLNAKTMSYLNTIKRIRSLWFQRLKAGLKVQPEGWKYGISSPQKLAQICKEEERIALVPDVELDTDKDKEAPFTTTAKDLLRPVIEAAIKVTAPSANKFYPVEKAFELAFSVETGTIDNTNTVVLALKQNRIKPVHGRWYDAEYEDTIKNIMNGIL
jgi:ParB/Sulfiredoxin domain